MYHSYVLQVTQSTLSFAINAYGHLWEKGGSTKTTSRGAPLKRRYMLTRDDPAANQSGFSWFESRELLMNAFIRDGREGSSETAPQTTLNRWCLPRGVNRNYSHNNVAHE